MSHKYIHLIGNTDRNRHRDKHTKRRILKCSPKPHSPDRASIDLTSIQMCQSPNFGRRKISRLRRICVVHRCNFHLLRANSSGQLTLSKISAQHPDFVYEPNSTDKLATGPWQILALHRASKTFTGAPVHLWPRREFPSESCTKAENFEWSPEVSCGFVNVNGLLVSHGIALLTDGTGGALNAPPNLLMASAPIQPDGLWHGLLRFHCWLVALGNWLLRRTIDCCRRRKCQPIPRRQHQRGVSTSSC